MKTKRHALRGALNRFENELRQIIQQLNDGVSFLTRTTQLKPCIGPGEFREVLSDIQEEVSDLTDEVENLEKFTVDTISFEELLGHCLVLYQANRKTVDRLEEHLQQFGYRPPPGMVTEPDNPLSVEAVAAAKARLGAGAGAHNDSRSDDEDDEVDEDADPPCGTDLRGTACSSRKTCAIGLPATGGIAPMSFLNNHRRKGTPVAKGRPASDSEDDGCDGGRDASNGEGGARQGKRLGMRQQQELQQPSLPAADIVFGGSRIGNTRQAGTLTGKDYIRSSLKAASTSAALAVAASLHASARKDPMSRAAARSANRDCLSPEQAYSPNTLKMLARYNPPADEEDERRVSISLAASFDKAGLPEVGADGTAAAVRAEELSAALRDLAMIGPRAGGASTAVGPVAWGGAGLRSEAPAQPPAVAASQKAPVDEETSMLYHELIRTNLDRPQQQVRPYVPPLNLAKSAAAAPAAQLPQGPASQRLPPPQQQAAAQQKAGAVAQSRIPAQLSPRPPLPPGGSTPEQKRPPATPGAVRSVTPLSVLRADRERHNKVLEEKLAGLERVWVESGQAARTPIEMRRSIGGGDLAAYMRVSSPGPSRAAAEAAAAAAAAAPGKVAWGPERQQQQQAEVANPHLHARKEADVGQPERVLSPLQSSSPLSGSATAACNPASHRGARISGLPGPPQTAVSAAAASAAAAAAAAALAAAPSPPTSSTSAATTVVGATTLPRRDGGSNNSNIDMALRGAAAKPATVAPRGTPVRPGRGLGTPGRVRQACSSSPTVAVVGAAALTRATEATTPRGPVRAALSSVGAADGSGGGVGEARVSKLTPHRRSYAAAPLEAAAAAAAAAAATAAIEHGAAATPSRARRVAALAATAAGTIAATAAASSGATTGMGAMPGRTHAAADEAGVQDVGMGAPSRTAIAAAAAAAALAPPVVPQLRLDVCRRADAGTGGGASGRNAWGGFPLSRRGADGSSATADRPTTSRTGKSNGVVSNADDVTLGMPPTVSQPSTPTTMTPGSGCRGRGGPTATSTSAAGGPSPNGANLASHPLGDLFGGPARPAGAVSRIPTPGRRAAVLSQLPTATALFASGAPPIVGMEPCSEAEWRSLPATVQMAFPIEVLNGHLRSLGQSLAARPPSTDAAGGRVFSAADLEALSLGSVAAKRLLNALVKLGRCQVAGGGIGGGTVLYRLPA